MKVIDKINAVISKILSFIMIVLFIIMIVFFSIQVFGRYIFSAGFTWTEELTRYGMIWMVFIGAAWIIINSSHVNISILEDALKKKIPHNIAKIVQAVIGLVFVIAVFVFSIAQLKVAAMGISANTGLSNAVQYSVFPISMGLSAWGYITNIIKLIADLVKKEDNGGIEDKGAAIEIEEAKEGGNA